MKRILAALFIIALVAFAPPKTFHFEFTPEEAQIIFDALGELPSKKVEGIRYKMMMTVQAQSDTTKVKR
jgi:hypothetical protein